MAIPKQFRETISESISPVVDTLSDAGFLPFFNQAVVSFAQIPRLVDEVSTIFLLDFAIPTR